MVDGIGNYAYPLSFYIYLAINSSVQSNDCTPEGLFLSFMMWAQTNAQVAADIQVKSKSAFFS